MRIVRSKGKEKRFGEIEQGECFLWASGNDVFIRVEDTAHAIDLGDGADCLFSDEDIVYAVNATLVIGFDE